MNANATASVNSDDSTEMQELHDMASHAVELLKAMADHECFNLVFSSSATVYGDPHTVPITEEFPLSATNPYGRTKLFIEEILRDLCKAEERWNCVLLRYFNPIGAHESGRVVDVYGGTVD